MSSEALREAFVWLEAIASADPKLVRPSGLAAALLAEVARLEQERDEAHANTNEGLQWLRDDIAVKVETIAALEAALAAAREREQRHTKALRRISRAGMGIPNWRAMADIARAALVDEPAAAMRVGNHPKRPGDDTVDLAEAVDAAAATLAEPGGRDSLSGSASAAADEPSTSPTDYGPHDHFWRDFAAADEPGETP